MTINENINIVYEDDFILVINKPSGLSVNELGSYFLVHRLDQRVSGLLLVAKDKDVAASLSESFQKSEIKKFYKAIVAQKPENEKDTLTHWLQKNSKLKKSKVSIEEKQGFKKAVLNYSVSASSEKYHMLNVELKTGRFHQIRAQLSFIQSPIVGDLKYGFKRSSVDGSIFLQAHKLAFVHPVTGKPVEFEIPIPELWKRFGFE